MENMAANLWSFAEMQSFYAKYAQEYDDSVSMESYPAPFLIGKWCIEHLESTRMKSSSTNSSKARNTTDMHGHSDGGYEKVIRVLDLGCGTGMSSVPFFSHKKFKFEIEGVDGSKEMLEKAKKHPFKSLTCIDIERESLGKGQYDLMVCIGVMDFVQNPQNFLEKARQLLSADGRIGLTLPEGGDMNSFDRFKAEKLVRESGFWVERHEKFTGYTDSSSGEHVYYHGYLLSSMN